MKTCCECKTELSLDNFHKNKNFRDGHSNRCKDCSRVRHKKTYEKYKEKIKLKSNNYYSQNKESILKKQKQKPSYHSQNPEYYKKYRKTEKHKEYMREYQRKTQPLKYKNDTEFRIKKILSNQVRSFLKGKKNKKTQELLGYSYKDFIKQVGIPQINEHIDHKIPISWFKKETPPHLIWDLRNLQILNEEENKKKSNNFNHKVDNNYKLEIQKYIKKQYKLQ